MVKLEIGSTHESKNFGKVIVESRDESRKGYYYIVRFVNTGHRISRRGDAVESGEIKDATASKKLYGVGICHNGMSRKERVAYKRWNGMIERCYDIKYHSFDLYGGDGVRVCDEWLDFSAFLKWHNSQPLHNHLNMQIDKDINGGRVYSPENCIIVPAKINTAIIKARKKEANLPSGVCFRFGRYLASMTQYGKSIHIGSYSEPKEASDAYRVEKKRYLNELAEIELLNGLISNKTHKKIMEYEV